MSKQEVWEADFIKAFRENIHRNGAEELLQWLEHTDFFEAPAGANHHGAYPGGLVKHSLNVYKNLAADQSMENMTPETIAICGLLHDVCKIGVYHWTLAGILNGGGMYEYRDPLPLGHGEKSVIMLYRFISLKDEEALAIRWHMGAYDVAVKGGSRDLNAAQDVSPLVYALHAADMRAMLEERKEERDGDA